MPNPSLSLPLESRAQFETHHFPIVAQHKSTAPAWLMQLLLRQAFLAFGYYECMARGSLWTSMLLFFLLFFSWGRQAQAYSLLTHEQLIDLTWKDSIVPLLLSRYPNLTPADLEHARAYAYGGCVIQDIGYYPYGDMMYS